MDTDAAHGENFWFTHEDFRLRDGFGDYLAVSDRRLYLVEKTPSPAQTFTLDYLHSTSTLFFNTQGKNDRNNHRTRDRFFSVFCRRKHPLFNRLNSRFI